MHCVARLMADWLAGEEAVNVFCGWRYDVTGCVTQERHATEDVGVDDVARLEWDKRRLTHCSGILHLTCVWCRVQLRDRGRLTRGRKGAASTLDNDFWPGSVTNTRTLQASLPW
jgi:hypothetical protein